ncbi:hypothetical protein LINPERPRIM_LOCUS24944, partial [Linum perenne]
AGPSKVGNWIDPNRDIRVADERVNFPHRCFERKSYSLELIRNLYQQEDEDEKEEEAMEQVNMIRSAPIVAQFNEVGSPISSVNQPTQEPSFNDIGWLRPVVGRWGKFRTMMIFMQNRASEKKKRRLIFLWERLGKMMRRRKENLIIDEEVGLEWKGKVG